MTYELDSDLPQLCPPQLSYVLLKINSTWPPGHPSSTYKPTGWLAYWVSNILDSCHRDSWLEYPVEWEGYGPEEQWWAPCQDILNPALLTDFHLLHPHPTQDPRHQIINCFHLVSFPCTYLSEIVFCAPTKHCLISFIHCQVFVYLPVFCFVFLIHATSWTFFIIFWTCLPDYINKVPAFTFSNPLHSRHQWLSK